MITPAIRNFDCAYILRWALAIVAVFVLLGCNKSAEDIEAVFVISKNDPHIKPYEEKTIAIGVFPAGKHDWEIENPYNWLTISPQSGRLNKSIDNLVFTVDWDLYTEQYPNASSKNFMLNLKSKTVKKASISLYVDAWFPDLEIELLTPTLHFDALKTIDSFRIYNPNVQYYNSLSIAVNVPWVTTVPYFSLPPETITYVHVEVNSTVLGSGTHHASLILFDRNNNTRKYRVDITATID
jgi:hypothetical protein